MNAVESKPIKVGDLVYRAPLYAWSDPIISKWTALAVAGDSGRVSVTMSDGWRGKRRPIYNDWPLFATYAEARAHMLKLREEAVAHARNALANAQENLDAALVVPENEPE